MANESRITLEITVDDKGSPVISAVAGRLDDLGKKAAGAQAPATGLGNVLEGVAQQGQALFGAFSPLLAQAGAVGVALGAAALVAKAATDQFLEFTSQVKDLSFMSGAGARDISILAAGLEDLGVSGDTVQTAMNKMSAAITAGDPVLNRLGVTVRDSNGQLKNGLTIFYESVDALGKMQNAMERNALSRELFGRGWAEMIPILQRGSAEIRTMGEESGKIVTDADIRNARELHLALRDLGNAFEALALRLGSALIPEFTKFIQLITPGNAKLYEMQNITKGLATDLEYVGLAAVLSAERVSSAFSDVGVWRKGGAGAEGSSSPMGESASEMKQRLTIMQQIAQLQGQARSASAISPEDQFGATDAIVGAQRQGGQNALDLAVKEGTYREEQVAALRVAIDAAANAQIEAARRKLTDAVIARDNAGWVAAAEQELQTAWDTQVAKNEVTAQFWAEEDARKETARQADLAWQLALVEQQIALDTEEAERKAQLQQEEADRVEEARQADLQSYFRMIDQMLEADYQAAELRAEMTERQHRLEEKNQHAMMVGTQQSFANMADAMLMMYNATGQKHAEFFKAWKAFKIAETIVNTYSAAVGAYNAMASIPYVGPILGAAAAAAAIAFGVAQIATIVSAEPGGGGGGGGVSAATPGGGYAYTPPVDSYARNQPTDDPGRPMGITINVYGSIVDHDAFAREITDSLRKAQEDRV